MIEIHIYINRGNYFDEIIDINIKIKIFNTIPKK